MSGQWPPEWDDQEEEFHEEAGQLGSAVSAEMGGQGGQAEARLSEVAAFLSSVPAPVMPDAVEARISAALAAEAASSAVQAGGATGAAAGTEGSAAGGADSHPVGTPPGRARVRRRGGGRRLDFLRRPVGAIGVIVVCLLLAGLGVALSRGGTSQPTHFSAAAPVAGSSSMAESSAAGSGAAGSNSSRSAAAGSAAVPAASGPEHAESTASFQVTASGTDYQRSTLAAQASAAMAAGSTTARTAPAAALRGCVLKVTGGTIPRLVDMAAYQGGPAYIIADSTHVWVVGRGCTAAKTDLIVSVALAGLPGNLRALVSVEQ